MRTPVVELEDEVRTTLRAAVVAAAQRLRAGGLDLRKACTRLYQEVDFALMGIDEESVGDDERERDE